MPHGRRAVGAGTALVPPGRNGRLHNPDGSEKGTSTIGKRGGDTAKVMRMDYVMEQTAAPHHRSFRDIAADLGVSERTITADYWEAMSVTTQHMLALSDGERDRQLGITAPIVARLLPLCLPEDEDRYPDLKAVGAMVKLLDHRAKVTGAYAPTKIAPTDPTGTRPYAEASREDLLHELRDLERHLTENSGDQGRTGTPAVRLAPPRADEPVAATWDVVPVDAVDGPRGGQDADGRGVGPP